MGDNDINIPFVRGAKSFVDRVAAAEDLSLVFALRVVLADGLDVLLEVVTEGKPDSSDLLFENSGNTRVFRNLGHVEDPAEQADTDREWGILSDLQGLARRAQSCPELLRSIEALGSGIRERPAECDVQNVPAPMKP